MSRFTLARDYRNIDPALTRIILIEAADRIQPSFHPSLSSRATRDLERLGVQVWTRSQVTHLDERGVRVGSDALGARTVLWAAGIRASSLGAALGVELASHGRLPVAQDLSLPNHPEVFVAGDLCHFVPEGGEAPLPAVATVALQQGRHVAKILRAELRGGPRKDFEYWDKGQLATIGRSRALLQTGSVRLAGFVAWCAWLVVHIYYLSGFPNRLLVLIQWAWSYLTFARGARLIVDKSWRSYPESLAPPKG